ncbi:T9SS type B sorting domain-containing protein [Gaetbulibacter sp. M240]|uniref:T9SS type B sorting domain-containing protein n=1 Tax=Gaetbulibacter sp. M240 TaxID=3126511 RepID=UPI00374FA32D
MKKIVLLTITTLLGFISFSQKEATNWYFGNGAGVKFDLNTATVSSLNNGQLNTIEGCTSISDANGNLVLYTDGSQVFNRNHEVMANGFGLLGDASSTQSAIVVPNPGDPNLYYIFTVGSNFNRTGLNYSIVDITMNGGLGEVTIKNQNLLPNCSEKITAVLKDCITKSIWVVTFSTRDGAPVSRDDPPSIFDTFYAYEVSATGIDRRPIKSPFNTNARDARGYLKLSPDGTKVACANGQSGLFIYDFDVATGIVSNETSLRIISSSSSTVPYGVEFSPDSQLLYIHASNDYFDQSNPELANNPGNHNSVLVQYNLNAPDIQNSETILDSRNLYRGALQLGPDGKIYRALSATYDEGSGYLGVIDNPNSLGTSANYRHNAVSLSPSQSTQGLPPFIASFFNKDIDIIKNGKSASNLALCNGDFYTLISEDLLGAIYTWTRDGNELPETSYQLDVDQEGYYQVYIDPNNGDCAVEGEAYVIYNDNPQAFDSTILQCDEDGVKDGLTVFNLNEAIPDITGNNPDLDVLFFTDPERTNQIDGNAFQNYVNPQIIYLDVINKETTCSSTAELTLDVSVTDSQNTELILCDDSVEDGIQRFNLRDADSNIVNGLPVGLDIYYYETYEDALVEDNKLPDTYENKTPYSQTIYARVENQNNCYGISEVLLTVNELPPVDGESFYNYCLNTYPETITIDAGLINDDPQNYSYQWSNGANDYAIDINEIGVYTVVVTNANNCSKEKTINVTSSNVATFNNIIVKDVSENNTITVLVSGEGVYEFALRDDAGTIYKNYQESNLFEDVSPGFYTVLVNDVKNDCGVVTQEVSVIGFPKFFTPNNDGYNDTWQLYGVSSLFQPETKIKIFDRYGKLLKELSPLGPGWNGTFQGKPLPTNDYWFVVELQDGRVFRSHFTLKN